MTLEKFELTSPNDFAWQSKIVEEPVRVQARLRELSGDLTIELFYDIILRGLGARNEATDASAVTAAGSDQWHVTVKTLRTLLMAKKWNRHDERNCPFIRATDGSISIVVMTGDKETGRKGFGEPTNQAEKGAVTKNFIENNNQLELLNQQSFGLAKNNKKETEVWVLLYHYDESMNEVRYEISYPNKFGKKKIIGWGERLILGKIPNDPSKFVYQKDTPNAPIIVEVEPKTGTF